MSTVKPHGRLPWFITASRAMATHIGHRNSVDVKRDSASFRSTESRERFRSQSRETNRELDTVDVMPRNPDDEKVFRKA